MTTPFNGAALDIRLFRLSTAEWENSDRILQPFELGFDTDANEFRLGDGVTEWENLPSVSGGGGEYAVEFDHTKGHNVNHGYYFPTETVFGNFFYEAWVKPYADCSYIISDGYGGDHALLWGFGGGTTETVVTGNTFNGSTSDSFSGNSAIRTNEWVHVAVGWDGTNIRTWINGQLDSQQALASRQNTPINAGCGVMFVGGSDHSNFNGQIRMIRGFEGWGYGSDYFKPEHNFRTVAGNGIEASFIADYTKQASVIQDGGNGAFGSLHAGVLAQGNDAGAFGSINTLMNLPQWVSVTDFELQPYSGTITPIPANAILFDAFERTDSTHAFSPTISWGDAPTGQTWIHPVDNCGIYNGQAFVQNNALTPPIIDVETADMDVTFAANIIDGFGMNVSVRRSDASNYIAAYITGGSLYFLKNIAGSTTTLSTTSAAGVTSVRIKCLGDSISLYINGSGAATTTATVSGLSGTQVSFMTQSPMVRLNSITVLPA